MTQQFYVSPEQLGLYGGEVSEQSDIYSLGLVLAAALRGKPIDMGGSQFEIVEKRRTVPDLSGIDLIFWGGGQDRDQELVFKDAAEHKVDAIRGAIDGGAVVLAVCGGYQLLGEYYVTADGKQLPGLALVDLHTVPGSRRNIGNIVIETSGLGLEPATLVGFENHSGKTYLGAGLQPLGRVLRGAGNNGEDGNEGVMRGNVFGTYLHGSLLPKNPHFADLLIERALMRKGIQRLAGLAATEELEAHQSVSERVLGRSASTRS